MPRDAVRHLIQLGCPRRRSTVATDSGFEISWLDLTQLKIRSSHFTPFLAYRRAIDTGRQITPDELIAIKDTATRALTQIVGTPNFGDSDYAIILVGAELPSHPLVQPRDGRQYNFAFLGSNELQQIERSRNLRDALRVVSLACARALGASFLAPYQTGEVARGWRFFGRDRILKRVAARSGASFTFIGIRRIGKTSLLQEIALRMQLEEPSMLFAHLHGDNLDSTYEVMKRIIEDTIHAERLTRFQERQIEAKAIGADICRVLQRATRRMAVFVDELDKILQWDEAQSYQLLNLLREMSHSGHCIFYFAGYRRTNQAVENTDNPLYNFTSVERILPFDRADTARMLEGPLENLGIPVTGPDLANVAFQETGGQPELLQHLGMLLVRHYDESGMLMSPQDLSDQLASDSTFEGRTARAFLQNTNSRQQLATLFLFKHFRPGHRLTTAEFKALDMLEIIESEFKQHEVDMRGAELRELISELELAGVVARVEGRVPPTYRFAVPRLREYLYDIEKRIAELVRAN